MSYTDFTRRFVTEDRTGTGRLAQRQSVIYFAQRARDGAVKVGVTTDLRHRIYRLRNAEHDQIEVIGVVPGGRYQEAQFHRALLTDRLDGEWFRPSPQVLAAAAGELLNASDPDPFDELPAPTSTRPIIRGGNGSRDRLRGQIADCWHSRLSGRDTATLLQISTAKLTREVKLMRQLGYFT